MPKGERLQDVKDWTSELIRASECRSIYYSSRNSTFQKQWIDALRYLKENRKKIYVQKGGEHKGAIINLPKKLTDKVKDVLTKIIRDEEEVIPEKYSDYANKTVRITDDPLYKRIVARDSNYSLLAALYSETKDDDSYITKDRFQQVAQQYCRHQVANEYNIGGPYERGAWSALDRLKTNGFVDIKVEMNNRHFYKLSCRGLQMCYALFNRKFIPPEYPKIEPQCIVTREGKIFTQNTLNSARAYIVPGDARQLDDGTPIHNRTVPTNTSSSNDNWENIEDDDDAIVASVIRESLRTPAEFSTSSQPSSSIPKRNTTLPVIGLDESDDDDDDDDDYEAAVMNSILDESLRTYAQAAVEDDSLPNPSDQNLPSILEFSAQGIDLEEAVQLVLNGAADDDHLTCYSDQARTHTSQQRLVDPKRRPGSTTQPSTPQHCNTGSSSMRHKINLNIPKRKLCDLSAIEDDVTTPHLTSKPQLPKKMRKNNFEILDLTINSDEARVENTPASSNPDDYIIDLTPSMTVRSTTSSRRTSLISCDPNARRKYEAITSNNSGVNANNQPSDRFGKMGTSQSKPLSVVDLNPERRKSTSDAGRINDQKSVQSIHHTLNPSSKTIIELDPHIACRTNDSNSKSTGIPFAVHRPMTGSTNNYDAVDLTSPTGWLNNPTFESFASVAKTATQGFHRDFRRSDSHGLVDDFSNHNIDTTSFFGAAVNLNDSFGDMGDCVISDGVMTMSNAKSGWSPSCWDMSYNCDRNNEELGTISQQAGTTISTKRKLQARIDDGFSPPSSQFSSTKKKYDLNFIHKLDNHSANSSRLVSSLEIVNNQQHKIHSHIVLKGIRRIPSHNSISSINNIFLLVDVRERKRNDFYRQMFMIIQQKSESHHFKAFEYSLKLGDFCFLIENPSLRSIHQQQRHNDDNNDKNESDIDVSDYELAHVVIERKCIRDLIESSSSHNPRHIKQERRLRFSGVQCPIFLIEGKLGLTINQPHPRMCTADSAYNADIMHSAMDLTRYFAGIICRNIGTAQVFIFQCLNLEQTSVFLTAMGILTGRVKYNTYNDGSSNKSSRPIILSQFHEQCHQNFMIKNSNEKKFMQELRIFMKDSTAMYASYPYKPNEDEYRFSLSQGSSSQSIIIENDEQEDHAPVMAPTLSLFQCMQHEFYERIIRKFPTVVSLKHAYELCPSEFHRRLLLLDLEVGGTNIDRQFLVHELRLNEDEERNGRDSYDAVARNESEKVWSKFKSDYREEFPEFSWTTPSSLVPSEFRCQKMTSIKVTSKLFRRLHLSSPSVTSSEIIRDDQSNRKQCAFEYADLLTEDHRWNIIRRSQSLRVVIIPGTVVVDAFLHGAFELGHEKVLWNDADLLMIVDKAIAILMTIFDSSIRAASESDQYVSYILVFETANPERSNSGALGRLNSCINKCQLSGMSSMFMTHWSGYQSRSPFSDSVVTPADVDGDIYLSFAKKISLQFTLLYMLLLSKFMTGLYDDSVPSSRFHQQYQVYQSSSANDSDNFIITLATESHRQALLIH